MAAVKLKSEFTSTSGKYYKIEIWDEDYTGSSPDSFTVDSRGFALSYSGDTDSIYTALIGSSVAFGMYVQDIPTRNFLSSLKQYQEDRYYIKIYRGTESDNSLYWAGYILQDTIEIEDISEPYILNIQATDGIAKMSESLCTAFDFQKLNDQFINALEEVGVTDLYGTDDTILTTVCNWWSALITYSGTANPLDFSYANFSVLGTINEDGTIGGVNWADVLKEVCTIFGLRFYYSDGSYRLEQLFERDSTFTEHFYKKDKTKISETEDVTHTKTIDQTTNQARLAGNTFNFLPAAKVVSIKVDKDSLPVNGVKWTNYDGSGEISPPSLPTLELGQVVDNNNNQLTFHCDFLNSLIIQQAVANIDLFPKFRLNVKLVDAQNNNTYYLTRGIGSNFQLGTASWSTTQAGSGYEVTLGRVREFSTVAGFGFQSNGSFSITTPAIPGDGGVVEVDWEFDGFITSAGTSWTINANNDFLYRIVSRRVQTTFGDITNQTTKVTATNASSSINSNYEYNLGTTKLFSGVGEWGSICVKFTALGKNYYLPSVGFREGNSGTYIPIQRLLCQEMANLMDEPVERYNGNIFSNHSFKEILAFESNKYLQTGGTFTANTDEWSGEWFVISRADASITFGDDPVDTALITATGLGGNSGSGGVDFTSGFSAVNPVLGGMTETTGGVKTAINEVSGTAASSAQRVGIHDHMNVVSFEGDPGNYDIDLPTAVDNDGLQIRFKSDGSIDGSHRVVLQTNGSETIDGATSYTLNRSYDGVTLMAYDDNWLVIQRKDKT